MKYKGYYIDKVTFNSKAEIDAFIKDQAVETFKKAIRMFIKHPDMAHSNYAMDKARALNKLHGFTWEEREKIEESVYETA